MKRDKRELLSSFISKVRDKEKPHLTRPPYFEDEELFFKNCSDCDWLCAKVCETNVIKITQDGTPYLDFSQNGCTYCDECAKICPSEVLKLEHKKQIGAKIYINKSKCLSWDHTMCFSCKDPCLDDAIDFQALFMPIINQKCTSCGFCISRCPSDAIVVEVF